jgi:REP element-mobilizing transposase RayT
MPAKNAIKEQISESYYHVYARGSNKQKLFVDNFDYQYFMKLIERYLSQKPETSKTGVVYPHYADGLELVAYCLMSNHFHLLIYQKNVPSMEKFMRSLMTSYGKYFNLKYRRTGPVFESRYKAACIDNETYLQHISRYIHLNPRRWLGHKYSSMRYYINNGEEPYWLKPNRILDQFKTRQEYLEFVSDYESTRDILHEIKYLLVDK